MADATGPLKIHRPLTAPQLYARSQGERCEGSSECYWCGSPCPKLWAHGQPPPQPFVRFDRSKTKRPENAHICKGCWLLRRPRITVNFLSAGKEGKSFKDVECLLNWSVLITGTGAWAIRLKEDNGELLETLLQPPLQFCLSLVTGKEKNHVQMAPVNDHEEIRADTPLAFNVDGIGYTYCTHELEQALLRGPQDGMLPGVRRLFDLLGPYTMKPEGVEKRKAGRPRGNDTASENPAVKVVTRAAALRKSG